MSNFKDVFLSYLPTWYKRQTEAYKLAGACGDQLQELFDLLHRIRTLYAHILSSTGEHLDWWGADFQVKRAPGEGDNEYRERILAAIRPKKVTKDAILSAVRTHFLGRGFTEGVHYNMNLDEYQKLSFRINIDFIVENVLLDEFLVAKIIYDTRAAGIYGRLRIGGNFYDIDHRMPGGLMSMNDPNKHLNGDFMLGPEFVWTQPAAEPRWGGFITTNGQGGLNSTYTMGNTFAIDLPA